MSKNFFALLILTVFLFSILTVTTEAKARIDNELSEKLSHYSFMGRKTVMLPGGEENPVTDKTDIKQSLGAVGDGNTPGELVAHTWYEMQQPSTMGRLIDWRGTNPQIHMTYTQMFAENGRRYSSYNVYDPVSGTWPKTADIGCPVAPPAGAAEGRSGFSNIDVRPQGGAVVACHFRLSDVETDPYSTYVYYDAIAPAIWCGFGAGSEAPNSLASDDGMEPDPEYIWPKLEYHVNGNDTVIYALSCENVHNIDLRTLVLFRNVGSSLQGTWEAYVIDTVFYPSHAITSSRISRKVVCCWLEEAAESVEGNNDVWCLESDDMGATWNHANKTNVTNYDPDEWGFRAWLELSCLYDTNDNLHIIWNASIYDGDGTEASSRSCRLFHWADHTGEISIVHEATWDPLLNCGLGGPNVLNIGKASISECNGHLYVIWSQFGSPETGDSTDCADADFVGFGSGANADLYLTMSTDLNGNIWDNIYNMTKTKTTGCDSTSGNECANEMWPSMSRYGMNEADYPGLDWAAASDAFTVDPSGGAYTDDYYLDVMYVNDVVPGLSEMIAGTNISTPNYNVPIKWFRLPCVDSIPVDSAFCWDGKIRFLPDKIYRKDLIRGDIYRPKVYITNFKGEIITIKSNDVIQANNFDAESWLNFEMKDQIVLDYNITDTFRVVINTTKTKRVPTRLKGKIIIPYKLGDNTVKDTLKYTVICYVKGVNDSLVSTISTNLTSLYCGPIINIGSYQSYANMDFSGTGLECDDSSNYKDGEIDTIPGDASIYLGDASPFILTADISGSDTNVIASWGLFDFYDFENIFLPVDGKTADSVELTLSDHYTESGSTSYDCFHTGSYLTIDSHLVIEKTYYAPAGDVSFILSMMRIFSYDGNVHDDLVIGEAFDWDIPSDTGVYNQAGTDPINDLIYLVGGEFNESHGDSLECTDNDTRAGGAVRIGYYTQAEYNSDPDILHTDAIWGGYTELNETYVYERKILIDDEYVLKQGFLPDELYRNVMDNPGLNAQAPSVCADQHIVLTYFDDYDLGATDTLIIWSALATVPPGSADAPSDLADELNAARTWFAANRDNLKIEFISCCEGTAGDANCSGGDPDISDITRLIDFLYLSHAELCCVEEADANCSGGNPDISDITRLIDFLYLSHAPLCDCP